VYVVLWGLKMVLFFVVVFVVCICVEQIDNTV
jgi:hypothetical protein